MTIHAAFRSRAAWLLARPHDDGQRGLLPNDGDELLAPRGQWSANRLLGVCLRNVLTTWLVFCGPESQPQGASNRGNFAHFSYAST